MCFQQSAIIYYRVECQSCEGLPELDRLLGIIVLARVLLPELDGEDGGVEAEEDAEGLGRNSIDIWTALPRALTIADVKFIPKHGLNPYLNLSLNSSPKF